MYMFNSYTGKSKPFFEVPIKDVSCRELDSCSFDCVVSGDPKPTVHWQHNGEKIMPNNKEIKVPFSFSIGFLANSGHVLKFLFHETVSKTVFADFSLFLRAMLLCIVKFIKKLLLILRSILEPVCFAIFNLKFEFQMITLFDLCDQSVIHR